MITFPQFSKGEDWYTYIFVADQYEGELIDSNEGVLAWVENSKLTALNLWPGDRIFLRWLDEPPFFSAKFVYTAGELTKYEVVFYTPGGGVERERWAAGAADVADAGFAPVYTPKDDTYCWVCGGAVVKRHCKIVCQSCGFTRDCSDP